MELLEDLSPLPRPMLVRESHFRFLGIIIELNWDVNEVWIQNENGEYDVIQYDDIIDWEIGDDVYYAIRGQDTVYWNIRRETE